MARFIYQGPNCYAVAVVETAYATGGTPAGTNYIGKIDSISLNMDNQFQFSHGLGEGRNLTAAKHGLFSANGSISGEVIDMAPFQFAIGDIQGSGTSGDPYELVEQDFIDYTDGFKSVHMEIGHVSQNASTDSVFDVTGMVYNGWSLTGTIGQTLRFGLDFFAKTCTKSTTKVTYTTPSVKPITISTLSLIDGSSNVLYLQSFNWAINNGASPIYETGGRFATYFGLGGRRYNFTFTLIYDYNDTASTNSGIDMLEIFFGVAGSNSPLAATVDPTAQTFKLVIDEGSATGDRDISIDLENCYITTWPHNINLGDDKILVTVGGVGFAGLTDGTDKVPVRFYTN